MSSEITYIFCLSCCFPVQCLEDCFRMLAVILVSDTCMQVKLMNQFLWSSFEDCRMSSFTDWMIRWWFPFQSNMNTLLLCSVLIWFLYSVLCVSESLTNCSLTRVDNKTNDQSLKLGHSVVLNITCAGRLVKVGIFAWASHSNIEVTQNANWNIMGSYPISHVAFSNPDQCLPRAHSWSGTH